MRNLYRFIISGLVVIICIFSAAESFGFCIQNQTVVPLFFVVEHSDVKGEQLITFLTWIEPGKSACCNWQDQSCNPSKKIDSKLSFYAFDSEESLEGCDVAGTASSDIKLNKFVNYDNCHWE